MTHLTDSEGHTLQPDQPHNAATPPTLEGETSSPALEHPTNRGGWSIWSH